MDTLLLFLFVAILLRPRFSLAAIRHVQAEWQSVIQDIKSKDD